MPTLSPPRSHPLAAGGGLAAALAVLASCSAPAPAPREVDRQAARGANLLLVTLDTTRADRLGSYGHGAAETPNLDGIAADGVLFEHCITPSAYTLPSHSSLMTGFYPPYHGVRINGDAALAESHTTLAERLAARGYRTGAFVGAFVLDGRWGLAQGFAHYDDEFELAADQRLDLAGVQRPADRVVDAALEWLGGGGDEPFFAWVHLYDPHAPYEPPEPYRSRRAAGGPGALYDGEISFADAQVGRLLGWLEERGAAASTLVVVVGDHGEGLGGHGESEHGYFIYDDTLRVPLLLRLPGDQPAGVRVRSQVRTVDVLPTIVDLLEGEAAPGVHGESLVPLVGAPEGTGRLAYSESMAVHLQYGWSALYGLRSDEHKFIEAPRPELYELASDPGESRNRLLDLRPVSRQMRRDLARIREEAARGAPEAAVANLDQETLAMLASLGYVGGGASVPRDGQDLADPKDKIHLYEAVGHAGHLMVDDEAGEAAEVLERVLAEDAAIPQAQLLLATAYRKTGRQAEAKSLLDAYLKRDGEDVRALITMGEILLAEGRREEVQAIGRRLIAIDERNPRAYELMAEVAMAAGDHRGALPLLRQVVEIQPKLTRSRINLAAALVALGRLGEAEELLAGILEEYPKFPLAHFHLGLLRERQGRPAEARAAYAAELAENPRSVVTRFNLGELLLARGDAAGAEEQMRALIEQDPASPRPYLLLARIALGRPGGLAAAETLALAGLERTEEPQLRALGYFLLADVYARQGRTAEVAAAVENGERYRALIR